MTDNPTPPLPPPASILIARLSSIGDCVHCLPALNALRTAFPSASIGWLVDDRAADILRDHPQIDHLHILPIREWKRGGKGKLSTLFSMRRFARSLREFNYDVGIDFQGLTKSAACLRWAGCPVRIGYGDHDGREISRWLNNRLVRPRPDRLHVIDRNNELLRPLGIDAVPPEFRFPELSDSMEPADTLFREAKWDSDTRPVMVYVSDTWESKNYPTEHLAIVADGIQEMDIPVVLGWGSPSEEKKAREVANRMRSTPPLSPPTTLREYAALVGRMRLFIGGDTGPMHIAAARGIPCVAVFGGSDPARNGPYGDGHEVLSIHQRGKRWCRTNRDLLAVHGKTLSDIPPEDVLNACRKLLNSG